MPYQFCATDDSVQSALLQLRSSAHLFLDLEGRDLGCDNGVLSIISIGTIVARDIFIFDALSLSRQAMQPVLDLLANSWTLKIVWDGRMDNVELQRSFGVSLGRVLDLQIADIVSRPERGAEDRCRMDRAWHPLHPVRHLDTDGIHGLTALKNALTAHGVYNSLDTVPIVDHSEWMVRPLPAAYLDYAANDIAHIAKVYALFQSRGHVTNRRRDRSAIETQSARYVGMHAGPIPSNDIFHSSNLLPLEILNTSTTASAKDCIKCGRHLSIESFTYFIGPRSEGHAATTHDACKVCYLLTERAAVADAGPSTSQTMHTTAFLVRPSFSELFSDSDDDYYSDDVYESDRTDPYRIEVYDRHQYSD